MKTLQKSVLLLSVLSLLGTAGVTPWCASCGPKVMDCCKGDPSQAESLNLSPCCDFRMSVTVEPHPARMTSLDSRISQDDTHLGQAQVVTRTHAVAILTMPPASNEGTLSDSSPPLFLLNASFLC